MTSFQIAKFAWHSAFLTLRAYPRLAIGVLVAMLVLLPLADLADGAIASMPAMRSLGTDGLVEQIVCGFAAAILAMATHRLVIVDDRNDHPIWRLPSHYWRFVLWTLAFPLANAVIHALSLAPAPSDARLIAQCVYVLAMATSVVITTRLSLLFPAIAVGDEEAGPALSWRITRGHFWKMVWSGLLSAIPLCLVTGIELFIAMRIGGGDLVTASAHGNAASQAFAILSSLTSVLFIPVFASVLSRFYQLYRHAPERDAGGMVADDPLTA